MKCIYLIIIVLSVSSCYSPRRAQKQLARAVTTYPKLGADYCAGAYPCAVSGSDTVYLPPDSTGYLDYISSLNRELQGAYEEQDSLIAALNADTACQRYEAEIKALRGRIQVLQALASKPAIVTNTIEIHDTVPDMARIRSLELARDRSDADRRKWEAKSDSWEKMAKTRFWIMWALILVIVGAAGYKIWSMTRPKVSSL